MAGDGLQMEGRVVTLARGGVCLPVNIVKLEDDGPAELGQTIHFTSTVMGSNPIIYTWDYGDGTPLEYDVGLSALGSHIHLSDYQAVAQKHNTFGCACDPGIVCDQYNCLTLCVEIAQERLEREYDLNLIVTTPNVVYRIKRKDGEVVEIDNPAELPSTQDIASFEEPYIEAKIMVPIDSMEPYCAIILEVGLKKAKKIFY